MADRPIPSGGAKHRNNSSTVPGSQTAPEPIRSVLRMATSTSARSDRPGPGQPTSSILVGLATRSTSSLPPATSPAAIPATVGSSGLGKALLVPVEMATIGVSPHSSATSRWVPSPPRTTMTPTPSATMHRVALTVSAAVPVRSSSTISTRGQPAPNGPPATLEKPGGDTRPISHHDHLIDAGTAEANHQPPQLVQFLVGGHGRAVSNEPSDVASRRGVGHNTHGTRILHRRGPPSTVDRRSNQPGPKHCTRGHRMQDDHCAPSF